MGILNCPDCKYRDGCKTNKVLVPWTGDLVAWDGDSFNFWCRIDIRRKLGGVRMSGDRLPFP
jgi:hypothetical protein